MIQRTIRKTFYLWMLIGIGMNVCAQNFRFAQMTDIHLSPGNKEHEEDLRNSIQEINAEEGVDFVLITGDISEKGDRETLKRAKELFDTLEPPYYIVMGNHETKWSDSGCTAWQEVFGYERFQMEHKGVHFLGFNTGPLMRMAYGHVVPQDLSWLDEELGKLPKDAPAIIVTHYPLMDGDVDNWYQVTDVLRKYNVRLCVGGHYHALRNLSYDGIPGVLMRSNLRNEEKKSGFGMYEVTRDSIRVMVHNQGTAPFQLACYSLQGPIKDLEGNILDPKAGANHYPSMEDNNVYSNVREAWKLETGVGVYSSPAYSKGRVFVGDDLGILTAYDVRDGKQLWQFRTKARIVGTPAAAGGIVVTGSADHCIYGLSAKTGKLLWKVECEAPVLGAVTIQDSRCYVGASDHKMRCIALKTGQVVWTLDGVEGYIETKPLVTKQHVVFGAWDNHLYSANTQDGTLQWKWKVEKGSTHYSPAAVWPVEAAGKVFVTDPDRAMSAIDAQTGKTVWRTKQSMVRETIGLSKDKKRVYSKTMNDSIVCYLTEGSKPIELWATAVGFGYEHAPSMPVEQDGVVYGSTKEGMIFALEAKQGQLLWRHKIGNSLISTVVPIGKHRILFTSSDGVIGMLTDK